MLESFFADFGLEHVLVLFMLAISVLMLAITFERSARFAWVRVSVLRARKVIEAARAGDLASARAACETIQQPVRTVFVAGLDRALGTVKGDPARAMARETKRIGGTLKDRTWMLATSGALMPFVGLFGTVIGVMGSFQAIGESGQGGFAVVSVGALAGADRDRGGHRGGLGGGVLVQRAAGVLHQPKSRSLDACG